MFILRPIENLDFIVNLNMFIFYNAGHQLKPAYF